MRAVRDHALADALLDAEPAGFRVSPTGEAGLELRQGAFLAGGPAVDIGVVTCLDARDEEHTEPESEESRPHTFHHAPRANSE